MSLTTVPLPYGLRDVKVTPYTDAAATTLGAAVDLPNARTVSFSDNEEFKDLRGDDAVQASHGSGPDVEWDIESGGLPLDALIVMFGGTIADAGVTPNRTKTYSKASTDSRPYFKMEGQAISDSGGDLHVILYKCKATGPLGGELKDQEFLLTSGSGRCFPSTETGSLGLVYDFVQNETVTAIA